ncbi:hypothetical protein GCM10023189_39870 [Nibrella saemangeumensis]|uniref:Outer membrane protein beta-barrel domain-containing protein n=1 Tax=Nibrella saemangeumensis TaxID=1084526 RepID=A0ABP8N7P1_9BACT
MQRKVLAMLILWASMAAGVSNAQDAPGPRRPLSSPITVSVFSESISLPTFKGFFEKPNVGVRIGTELYYRNRPGSQLFQTVNLGYYHHRALHHGLFVSSEFGYRKFIGPLYLDATIGGGYLHLIPTVPMYRSAGGEFTRVSPHLHKFMPTLGLGAGYRINQRTSVFSRYEVFGEMPVVQDVPVLPHKALHVGARLSLSR